MNSDPGLRRRLLQDIAELQTKPYPNITLHVQDEDLSEACLILTPDGWRPLHLTVQATYQYPLKPPTVRMDSKIAHPNVFETYICASILNTTEGYTPAYTLKGIAIQLLSFFGSDSVQQSYGDIVDLGSYRERSKAETDTFKCRKCRFGHGAARPSPSQAMQNLVQAISAPSFDDSPAASADNCCIDQLPDEVLLQIIDSLDFEELTKFARSWNRLSRLIADFNVIRTRELQCFVLKENFLNQKLGVGVHVAGQGRGRLESEFDLLSKKAYRDYKIRLSVHGMDFEHWLPLPISQGHWRRVRGDADDALSKLSTAARLGDNASVLYAFMNDIVARLNADLELGKGSYRANKSSLRHASEKAIESYIHLFHLLICLATAPAGQSIVADANRMINTFMSGRTSKTDIPNLGNLLIALLISDIEPTEALMKAIVTEAITRNVVWLLDHRGAGMAELGYLEKDDVSHYRLKKTFEGSRVSYRILMFSQLFRRTARPSPAETIPAGSPEVPRNKKSLAQIRDELFSRHGSPPAGSAAHLAAEVRRLQQVDDFPSFLREMGVPIPSPSVFTSVLRDTMKASFAKGYHKWGAAPNVLARVRLQKDDSIDYDKVLADIQDQGLQVIPLERSTKHYASYEFQFFPKRQKHTRRGYS
ncbi:hypothetical protein B0H66DRAFT_299083 [Apodospora peruviana]|uniref:UBC core domain-containing protein n=1 Tax=Apodospora peruviana TaxID=516989 RepID=A0AAE0I102_9PEZI|nr:hypothetical protein B0H66DRAFT_299083 [Apodospora peruviana]